MPPVVPGGARELRALWNVTPEGRVKAAIKTFLKTTDAWWYMPVQNGMGVTGIPDFILCVRGRFVGIECKAPGKENTVTVNQQRQIERIQAAQGCVAVVTNVEQVKVLFADLIAG